MSGPEERLTDCLRLYASYRGLFVDALPASLFGVFASSSLVHIMGPVTALCIAIAVFARTRSLSLFSFHPMFMSIGVFCFVLEGLVAFRNRSLVDALAPIMEAPKKNKARSTHRMIQMIGAIFLAIGLMSIAVHKINIGKTLLPVTLHALFGVLSVVLVCIQIVVGMEKLELMHRTNSAVRIRRWHGLAGGLTWDLLVGTVLLGMLEFLETTPFTIASLTLVVIVWITAHVQLKVPLDSSSGGGVPASSSDYASSVSSGASVATNTGASGTLSTESNFASMHTSSAAGGINLSTSISSSSGSGNTSSVMAGSVDLESNIGTHEPRCK